MKKFTLALALALCIGSLSACGGSSTPASSAAASNGSAPEKTADPIVITFTHATSEETSQQAGALAFKEYVEANSDGKMIVNVYPNSQMGGDREQIEGTQEGSITAMTSGSAPQVNFVGSAVIFDLPFAFSSNEDAFKVFQDENFNQVLAKEYEKAGLKLLGASFLDFRATTANFPINTPADLSGMTIRTMENKYHMAMWQEMGANPTPLAFNELYTALQQGTVDGQENPLELIYAQKFYEQQKYVIKTRHLPQTLIWIMNKDFYDGLSDDLKQVVDGAAKAAMEAADEYTFSNVERIEKELTDQGITIIDLTPEQIHAFSDKTKETWDMVKADVNPDVYDAFMAALKK